MPDKILLASPRGFCAGVKRAINIVEKTLDKCSGPIYVLHHIVHNKHVIENFEKKGVIFVDDIENVSQDSILILSAHGSSPDVIQKAKTKTRNVIDVACPFVKKIHIEAKRYHEQGYDIVLIGKKGHQEVVGISGYAPVTIINSLEEAKALDIINDKIAYLTQTTLSVDQTKEIIETLKKRFPTIVSPVKEDICYATTNRQLAVKEVSKQSDLVLVVGSKTSSNSNSLRDVAQKQGTKAYLIDDKSELDMSWLNDANTIGITSGASVPEELVEGLVTYIKEKYPNILVENVVVAKENISMSLPKELD